MSIEDGVLTIRFPDDPEEVVKLPRLATQMHGRARDLRAMNGEGVIYVHGDELVPWLRSLPRPTVCRAEFLRAAELKSPLPWGPLRRAR